MASPSATSSQRRAAAVGSYFFYIEGLPKRFTWQDLKDLVRKEASHGIWTEMALYPSGQEGDRGWARVQRAEEAANLYRYLAKVYVENKSLRVHLWDCTRSPPELRACNCQHASTHQAQGVEVARMVLDPSWRAVAAQPTLQPATSAYTTTPAVQYVASTAPPPAQTAMMVLEAAMANARLNPHDPVAQARAQQYTQYYEQAVTRQLQSTRQQPMQQPLYVSTSIGTPVNASGGVVRTESRGIFVSGLNFKARTRDIESFFGKAGKILKCDLQKDSATGKSKGNATIQYASAEDARKAVQVFDGQKFMSMRLNVRPDREATAVVPPSASSSSQASRSNAEPIIVDGSRSYQARKDSAISVPRFTN